MFSYSLSGNMEIISTYIKHLNILTYRSVTSPITINTNLNKKFHYIWPETFADEFEPEAKQQREVPNSSHQRVSWRYGEDKLYILRTFIPDTLAVICYHILFFYPNTVHNFFSVNAYLLTKKEITIYRQINLAQ